MSDILRSVGLDVGTTSTQMIFSELTVENRASGFAVPEMEIARRDIRYRSPVYFTPLLDESHVDAGALREETPLLEQLTTREAGRFDPCREKELVISFSGGVADCIEKELPWLEFGDIGPILGQTIRESRLCGGEFTLGSETIRATVIGAGCHSAQLSGSTVFHQNVPFPLKNVPVVSLTDISRETIRRELGKQEDSAILAFPGVNSPGYREVAAMAEEIAAGTGGKALICLEQDMAKALGQALALRLGCNAQILCIDRVKVSEGSYLDVGAPVGPALPVVVKTLVLGK